MKVLTLTLLSFLTLTWGNMNLWADVGLLGKYDFQELDYRLGFMMDNYQIITFEKCLYEKVLAEERTEDVFQRLVSRARELRPNSKAKILFYWHVSMSYKCYHSIDDLVLRRPDLWFNDTNGDPIMYGGHKKPFYDYRIPEAFEHWVSAALDVVAQCEGRCQGVYLDGIKHTYLTKCRVKTCGPDKESCCEVTEQDEMEWNEARIRAAGVLRERLHNLDPSYIVIGNDVGNYDFNSGKPGHRTIEENIDVVDGFSMDHFMTFEDVNPNAVEQPFVRPENIENRLEARNIILQNNKTLILRGAPGPVSAHFPWTRIGRFSIPSLPDKYHYPSPKTILEVQKAYKDLLNYPLAVYLCGFADPDVYFSYMPSHTVKYAVPCRRRPETCMMPPDLDQLFNNDPGAPD